MKSTIEKMNQGESLVRGTLYFCLITKAKLKLDSRLVMIGHLLVFLPILGSCEFSTHVMKLTDNYIINIS